jgi:hypothetical protein
VWSTQLHILSTCTHCMYCTPKNLIKHQHLVTCHVPLSTWLHECHVHVVFVTGLTRYQGSPGLRRRRLGARDGRLLWGDATWSRACCLGRFLPVLCLTTAGSYVALLPGNPWCPGPGGPLISVVTTAIGHDGAASQTQLSVAPSFRSQSLNLF